MEIRSLPTETGMHVLLLKGRKQMEILSALTFGKPVRII